MPRDKIGLSLVRELIKCPLDIQSFSGSLSQPVGQRLSMTNWREFVKFVSHSFLKSALPCCCHRSSGLQRGFEQFLDKFSDAGGLGLARAGDVQRPNAVLLEEFGKGGGAW